LITVCEEYVCGHATRGNKEYRSTADDPQHEGSAAGVTICGALPVLLALPIPRTRPMVERVRIGCCCIGIRLPRRRYVMLSFSKAGTATASKRFPLPVELSLYPLNCAVFRGHASSV
jgi:hypothetical protein